MSGPASIRLQPVRSGSPAERIFSCLVQLYSRHKSKELIIAHNFHPLYRSMFIYYQLCFSKKKAPVGGHLGVPSYMSASASDLHLQANGGPSSSPRGLRSASPGSTISSASTAQANNPKLFGGMTTGIIRCIFYSWTMCSIAPPPPKRLQGEIRRKIQIPLCRDRLRWNFGPIK